MADGLIYIDAETGVCCPIPFNSIPSGSTPFIAPYWIDNDPSMGGNVSYEIHQGGSPMLKLVSDYISSNQSRQFCGTWMMMAYWWDVPELFVESDKVSNIHKQSMYGYDVNNSVLVNHSKYKYSSFNVWG